MSAAPAAEFDHLVVAGATLAQAIEYVADLTGVAPRPGGQHAAMGTHNALVRLGRRVYLELIAIDLACRVRRGRAGSTSTTPDAIGAGRPAAPDYLGRTHE
ncbi:MAG: VOC family protein [Betaproteobacteria bacterium]|nr:VOC family protein [Betaproteobacteria bacterium]